MWFIVYVMFHVQLYGYFCLSLFIFMGFSFKISYNFIFTFMAAEILTYIVGICIISWMVLSFFFLFFFF